MAPIALSFLILMVEIFAKPAAADQVPEGDAVENYVVLLTGGYRETSSVEVFSLDGSCSKDLPDIPDERVRHTTQLVNGEVIMCGGEYTKYSCLSLGEENTFVYHSRLALPFIDLENWDNAIVYGDKFLLTVHGGQQSWNESQWIVQSDDFADIRDEAWISCLAVSNDGTVIMNTRNEITRAVKVFKHKDGMIEQIANYPGEPRQREACAIIQTPEGESFLIAGGNWEKDSYLYNIEKDQWEEAGNLAATSFEFRMLNLDGKVVLLDGGNRDVYKFNVETKTWTKSEQKMKRPRWDYDAVLVPGSLVGC